MKKTILLTCMFCLALLCSHAQVKIKDGTQVFYNRLVWQGTVHLMTQEALLNAPAQTLPVSFLDTLKKYNWYDLCQYYFVDKAMTSPFTGLDTTKPDQLSHQLIYFSVSPTGVVHRNYFLKTVKPEFAFYTNTFDTATATRVKSVTAIKGSNYLVQENYGETEHLRIVSYSNSVMILETTRFGKPGERPVMFRSAYLAMKKD